MSKTSRFVAAAAVLVFSACDTDGPLDPSRVPPLPPAAGVDADFSFFAATPAPGGTTTAWNTAVQRATAANSEMASILAVPLAALTDAATATRERRGSSWVWDLAFDVAGEPYEGELRSSVVGGGYGWDLILTAPTHSPVLTDYLWMTGLSGSAGNNGAWYIADAAAGSDAAIATMSWERGPQNAVSFAFALTGGRIWVYQREDGTNTLTLLVGDQIRQITIWRPATGTGSTWSSDTDETLCWNASRHNAVCA